MARAMGIDPAAGMYVPFGHHRPEVRHRLPGPVTSSRWEKEGMDFWWLDWRTRGQRRHAGH